MKKSNKPFDVNKIRAQAAQSIQDGAVTKGYALDIDQACENLNVALATEIMCVLRYRQHEATVKGLVRLEIAAEFKEHAEEEERHMLMLTKRIQDLGGKPDLNPENTSKRSVTEFGKATGLRAMMQEDLIAERIAIDAYRALINWFGDNDSTTRKMLEDILKDEEEHASDLADLLANENGEFAEYAGRAEKNLLFAGSPATH